jgi:hypothetical protein
MDSDTLLVGALAARALLLDRGDAVCIGIAGDEQRADRIADAVDDALETQYEAGSDLFPFLAHPEAIGVSVITTRHGSSLILEHFADEV